MSHTKHLTLLSTLIVSSGCWSERSPCDLWAGKLSRGEEVGPAIRELQVGGCVQSRGLLLEHLGDPGVESDVLAALVGLGRSPEAEAAIKRGLSLPATTAAAARQLASWSLEADAELRAALGDEALVAQRPALLEAALATSPARRWVGELVRALGDDAGTPGPLLDTALKSLAALDWTQISTEQRTRAVEALAELATRPGASSTRRREAFEALGRARGDSGAARLEPTTMGGVVERARAGDRVALVLLAALEHPASEDLSLALATRTELDHTTRWLALALLRLQTARAAKADAAEGGALVDLLAKAPADADVMLGLAMTIGPRAGPALTARRETEKGATRAYLARAQSVVLTAEELTAWRSSLEREASLLLRGLPKEPVVAAFVDLTLRHGFDPPGLASFVGESARRLGTLDEELAKARAELGETRARIEAETRGDSERAKILAQASGDALAEARVELAAIRARLETAYAPVERLTRELETHERLEAEVLLALTRLVGSAEGVAAGRAVLGGCPGEACTRLRAWAVAAIDASERSEGEARLALFMKVIGD